MSQTVESRLRRRLGDIEPEGTDLPKYVTDIRSVEGQENLHRAFIERSILREWKREWSFDLSSPTGLSWLNHYKVLAQVIFPKIDQHEFFDLLPAAFEETFMVRGRQIINLIGCKSSGKTSSLSIFVTIMTWVDQDYTRSYIAGPFKQSADSNLFANIDVTSQELSKYQPANSKIVKVGDRVEFRSKKSGEHSYKCHPLAGYIELVTVDKTGKLQGIKSRDASRGLLIVVLDEIGTFESRAFLDIIENIDANYNLVVITACNFKSVNGLEGALCDPEGKEYEDLDIDVDIAWNSGYESRTYRFDGHRSPNVLAGRNKYLYLLRLETIEASRKRNTEQGLKYYEQIRSFPSGQVSDNFVLTKSKFRSGGAFDDFVEDAEMPVKVAYLDPGFGGDPCKIGAFEFVLSRVVDASGKSQSVHVFRPTDHIVELIVRDKFIADADWINRNRELSTSGSPPISMSIGDEVSIENQIAVMSGEFLESNSIPRSNFGFDGSMRAAIVQEMISVLGGSISADDTSGPATDSAADESGRKSKDVYDRLITEWWFSFARMVRAGQFRGGNFVETAIAQICRRAWKFKGKRKSIETKTDFRSANQGKSCDDADVVIGAFQMALRRGFPISSRRRPTKQRSVISNPKSIRPGLRPMKAVKLKNIR